MSLRMSQYVVRIVHRHDLSDLMELMLKHIRDPNLAQFVRELVPKLR